MERQPILTLTFEIMYPSLNEYVDAERGHRIKGAKLKKRYTSLTKLLAMNKGRVSEKVDVQFIWYTSTKHDPDNIAFAKKFILDGLQLAKVIKDDKKENIGNFQDVFVQLPKKKPGYVVVKFFKHDEDHIW